MKKNLQGALLPILYEDNHIIAVNKRAGIPVQQDSSGDDCVLDLVKAFIKERDGKPGNVFLGLPHRLDRPTSGVVLLAKTSKALSRLAAAFRERKTEKLYWAVVEGRSAANQATLRDWLIKKAKTNTSRVVSEDHPGAKSAVLDYTVLNECERYSLLEVHLHTGRHHQIRVQLSALGHPVRGDLKYGARRSNPGGGISLHARELKLEHPVGKQRLVLTAPPPDEGVWMRLLSSDKIT